MNANPQSGSVEDLHAQVVRLKRQRDKLTREKQELTLVLNDTQDMLATAKAEVARGQVRPHKGGLVGTRCNAGMLRLDACAFWGGWGTCVPCHNLDRQ